MLLLIACDQAGDWWMDRQEAGEVKYLRVAKNDK